MYQISEIGITKYLPFVVTKKSLANFEAKFSIEASKIEVIDSSGEWVPLSVAHPRLDSITYNVTIHSESTREISVDRDNAQGRMRVDTHGVMFSNNTTSMQNLRANVGFLVFSTVAKVLNEFASDFLKDFQCFSFIPAHDKLVNVYEILSKESEKQGFLTYVNKNSGKRSRHWYLLNNTLWRKYKQIKGIA